MQTLRKNFHLTLIRQQLVIWAIRNEMKIVESNNEMFHCEDYYSELFMHVPHALYSLKNGWSIDELCQNEKCCKVDENGDCL